MSEPPKPDLIAAAEYARRIGVSGARLTRLFQRGMPFQDGPDARNRPCKLVDPAVCDAWRAANLDIRLDGQGRVRGLVGAASGSSADADRIAESALQIQTAKARREDIATQREELRLLKDQGALVDRRAALGTRRQFVSQIATAIDRMPADNATVLAAALGCTEHQAFQALRRVGDRMRDDLARYADERAGSAAGGSGPVAHDGGGDPFEAEA